VTAKVEDAEALAKLRDRRGRRELSEMNPLAGGGGGGGHDDDDGTVGLMEAGTLHGPPQTPSIAAPPKRHPLKARAVPKARALKPIGGGGSAYLFGRLSAMEDTRAVRLSVFLGYMSICLLCCARGFLVTFVDRCVHVLKRFFRIVLSLC